MPPEPAVPLMWRTARAQVRLDRAVIVGILNVTTDSFWDGGHYLTVEAAVRRAESMLYEGADVLDVGGESTRPGATPVSVADEIARVIPVISELVRRWPDAPVSVDTVKADVASAALDAGAAIINDVSGLRIDPALAGVAAAGDAGLILMHSRGSVDSMAGYELAVYGADPVGEVTAELAQAVERARAGGVSDAAIVVDPGLGFAKRTEHSIAVLAGLRRVAEAGYPVLVGPSRKRFIGEASGGLPAEDRLEGTLAACVIALMNGARLFRVHDVAPVRRALDLALAVKAA
ncbi:dihydropteroate synthase [soil metagenome]